MITIAGVVGVGKSTLTEKLSKELNIKPHYEEVEDNPILRLYYEDRARYGFLLQMYLLNTRYQVLQDCKKQESITDRSIYEDLIFAEILTESGEMSKIEFETYKNSLNNIVTAQDSPELLIFLHSDFETMLARIAKRGRDFEQVNDSQELLQYYHNLWLKYQTWYDSYNEGPKILIDLSDKDLHSATDWNFVLNEIKQKLKLNTLVGVI